MSKTDIIEELNNIYVIRLECNNIYQNTVKKGAKNSLIVWHTKDSNLNIALINFFGIISYCYNRSNCLTLRNKIYNCLEFRTFEFWTPSSRGL